GRRARQAAAAPRACRAAQAKRAARGRRLHLGTFALTLAPRMLVSRSPKSRRWRRFKDDLRAYGFLLPALVILGVFKVLPAAFAVWISLFKWDIVQGPFRGLDNY